MGGFRGVCVDIFLFIFFGLSFYVEEELGSLGFGFFGKGDLFCF